MWEIFTWQAEVEIDIQNDNDMSALVDLLWETLQGSLNEETVLAAARKLWIEATTVRSTSIAYTRVIFYQYRSWKVDYSLLS